MIDAAFLVTSFATLFVVVDPIGLVPMFIALTNGKTVQRRLEIAVQAVLVAGGLMTLFGLAGEALLTFIGISMSAFRVSGGILLLLTALDMLFERRTQRREGQAVQNEEDPSVFPLATPLIAGPGALASMILLTGEVQVNLIGLLAVHLVMFGVLACVLLLFLVSSKIENALGRTGRMVVTRLLGMLLAALSVQFIIDGLIGSGLLG